MNLLSSDGQTPLHLAARSLTIEKEIKNAKDMEPTEGSILLMLLDNKKIDINAQDDKRRTPLHYAIMRNHSTIVHILLQRGAENNVSDLFNVRFCFSFPSRYRTFKELLHFIMPIVLAEVKRSMRNFLHGKNYFAANQSIIKSSLNLFLNILASQLFTAILITAFVLSFIMLFVSET